MVEGDFGIVANVKGDDRQLRHGAKVWLVDGTGGEGWYRFVVRGLSKHGKTIEKWVPTHKLENFRAKWIPEHLRETIRYQTVRGDRDWMTSMSAQLGRMVGAMNVKRVFTLKEEAERNAA